MRQDTKMPRHDRQGNTSGARRCGHSYGDAADDSTASTSRSPRTACSASSGPSGCGKSTLLELVCGLREPDAGSIEIGGARAADARLARCAFMPQRDLLFPWLSALDNAALALRNRGAARGEARRRAAELFARFGLGGFEDARPAELSGGMRQRVAFLRTLLSEQAGARPRRALRLARRDHPRRDAELAGRRPGRGARARSILVTHDVEEALYLSDRVAVLSARPARIVEELAAPAPRARRPRRRGHRPRLRRRPRAGDAGPARGDALMRRWLLPALLLAALLGAWQLAAEQRRARRRPRPRRLPRPLARRNRRLALGEPLAARRKRLGDAEGDRCSASAARLVVGLAFAVVLHLSETLRRAFYPLLVASQTIPIIVIAPILVVWFGFGIGPKLAIVALICFFPITVNAARRPALGRPRGDQDDADARRLALADPSGGSKRRPRCPYVFSGARIAVAFAPIGAVFGEWAGSSSGPRPS